MTVKRIEIAPKLIPVFSHRRGTMRYRVLRGGRGSGKSFTAAKMAAIWGAIEPLRILCTRDMQNSIKESFHAELKNAIQSDEWLESQYDVGVDYLRHKRNGTEFLFKGLRHNIGSVKSTAQIDLCIVEEAEDVPHASWNDLLPTIRAPKSEVWIIYNPKRRDSYVAKTFDATVLPPRTVVADVNSDDNPWLSDELREQREHARRTMDPALYAHVWEGAYWERSAAQVFSNKFRVGELEYQKSWNGPYFGLDFGFSTDPTAGVKCWIAGRVLYIEHELYEHGLELDHYKDKLIKYLPDAEKHIMRADNSRPETISYLKRHGLRRVIPCAKGKGSVEHGVEYMLSFDEIVIHPRCNGAINEFNKYSYRVDKLSNDVLPELIDKDNHAIDAIRYALEAAQKRREVT